MKLTKEQVYINLQGKSKEELTDLWEFLDSIGEKQFRKTINDFLNNYHGWTAYEFNCDYWILSSSKLLIEKTEVTIEQLKEILQPMENKGEQLRKEAKERGYTHDNFKCLIDQPLDGNEDIDKWYYAEDADTLYTMPEDMGGNAVYRDGVWAEIVTLEQQLQKAEAEVKRLKEAIEESKIKVGDWVINLESESCFKWVLNYSINSKIYKKITDQQLINKLNELLTIKK